MKFPKSLAQFKVSRLKLRVFRNTHSRKFGTARLPLRQWMAWLGPVFVLAQWR